MAGSRCCAALLTALFVVGCASQEAAEQPAAAAATAVGQTGDAAQATTASASQAGDVKAVNLKDMTQPNTGVICRQVLRQGSNVIVTQCTTPEGWKAYERRKVQEAQEMLRTLQGSAYR